MGFDGIKTCMKRTKVLLIFPPFTVSSSDYPTPDPPLGLGYLAAVLEKAEKFVDSYLAGRVQKGKLTEDVAKKTRSLISRSGNRNPP